MDGVPSLWERRYNLSSADSFSCYRPPRRENLPATDIPQPRTASLHRHFRCHLPSLFLAFFADLVLSSFLFHQVFFFFFFGSATVPLAARESPLTRRMDDLRISSRSLSLVRSRYHRRSTGILHFVFFPQFSLPPFFFLSLSPPGGFHRFHEPTRSPASPSYRKQRRCPLCRDAARFDERVIHVRRPGK